MHTRCGIVPGGRRVALRPVIGSVRGLLTIGLVAWTSLLAPARAQITLEWDFDHGALDLAQTSITPTQITLGPRSDIYLSRWIYCRASGVLGLNPEFRITNAHVAGSSLGDAHRYVYSYDQQTWAFFDFGENSDGYYRFSNLGPFTADVVWLAYALPYPWAATEAHMDRVSASPWVFPTPSADVDFVLGASNAGNLTDRGRPVPQLPMYGYLITDPESTGPKTVVVLTTGTHPNETTGSYTFDGLVDFVLSDDQRAAALRAVADFYVYPNCNPDGRWAGHARSSPEVPNVDHNHDWDNPIGYTNLTILTAAMKADTGSAADYFFDFHAFNDPENIAIWIYAEHVNTPFVQGLVAREPTIQVLFGSSPPDSPGVSRHWAHSPEGLNAEYTFTPESGFVAGWPVTRYRQQGRNYALALYDALVLGPCADLNTDGAVIWQDDFDAGTSGLGWNLHASSSDYTADFAYDYSVRGIPSAPHSLAGSTVGARFTVNQNDGVASAEGLSAYPAEALPAGDHALRFDLWMNYNGGSGGGSGSTEFLVAGLGHAGDRVAWPNNPASDGAYVAVSGEGGAVQDYRAYVGPSMLTVDSGAYIAGSQNHTAALYHALFPSPPFETPGAPGKHWVEVELRRRGANVEWRMNGVVVAVFPHPGGDGQVMIGYMDVFPSLANPAADNFVIIDNVRVVAISQQDCNGNGVVDACEPIGGGDFDVDGDVDAADAAGLADCLAGPDQSPAPVDAACVDVCLAAFDFDGDEDIDLADFAALSRAAAPGS